MYAITDSGYRAISTDMPLALGETKVEEVPTHVLEKIKAEQMRAERGQRLRSTDWTQMDDASLSAEEKLAYAVYRQQLRDLPSQVGYPNVPWPVVPKLTEGAASNEGIIEPLGD